jgi:FkbM family methyltransferase
MRGRGKAFGKEKKAALARLAANSPDGFSPQRTMNAVMRRLAMSFYHRRILGRKRWRVVRCGGIKYRIRWDGIGRKIVRDDFEIEQFAFLAAQMRECGCDVLLDVGAHLGAYSLRAAAANLCREIYAVEGSVEIFDALRKNIALNNFGGIIKPINAAVSDAARKAIYYDDSETDNSGGSGLAESRRGIRGGPNPAAREIKTTTLDDLFSLQDRRIALKMDVEGHEARVLQGAATLLAQNRVLLQVEVWPENAAHLNLFLQSGFRIIRRFADDFFLVNFPAESSAGDCAANECRAKIPRAPWRG